MSVLGRPCQCGPRGLDDLDLCSLTGKSYVVQCKVCGEQWRTRAKYAEELSMDYSAADLAAFGRPRRSVQP